MPAPNPDATPAPAARKVPVIVPPVEDPADYPAPTGIPKAWGAALEGYGEKK